VLHLQWLMQQAAQRVFLVAGGELTLLEGGVAEYVQQLSGSKKKKQQAAAGSASKGASMSAAAVAGKAASMKRLLGKR
jgi:hypothetical protein